MSLSGPTWTHTAMADDPGVRYTCVLSMPLLAGARQRHLTDAQRPARRCASSVWARTRCLRVIGDLEFLRS